MDPGDNLDIQSVVFRGLDAHDYETDEILESLGVRIQDADITKQDDITVVTFEEPENTVRGPMVNLGNDKWYIVIYNKKGKPETEMRGDGFLGDLLLKGLKKWGKYVWDRNMQRGSGLTEGQKMLVRSYARNHGTFDWNEVADRILDEINRSPLSDVFEWEAELNNIVPLLREQFGDDYYWKLLGFQTALDHKREMLNRTAPKASGLSPNQIRLMKSFGEDPSSSKIAIDILNAINESPLTDIFEWEAELNKIRPIIAEQFPADVDYIVDNFEKLIGYKKKLLRNTAPKASGLAGDADDDWDEALYLEALAKAGEKTINQRDWAGKVTGGEIMDPESKLSDPTGNGLWDKAWNIYRKRSCPKSRKLMSGEKHTGCKNFCGPGTRVDLAEVRNFPPSDKVDAVCKKHDLAYYAAKDLTGDELHKAIRKADEAMLQELEKIGETKNVNYAGIKAKMLAEKTKLGKTILSKTLGPQYVGGQTLRLGGGLSKASYKKIVKMILNWAREDEPVSDKSLEEVTDKVFEMINPKTYEEAEEGITQIQVAIYDWEDTAQDLDIPPHEINRRKLQILGDILEDGLKKRQAMLKDKSKQQKFLTYAYHGLQADTPVLEALYENRPIKGSKDFRMENKNGKGNGSGKGLEEDKAAVQKGVKGATTAIGTVTGKILPGSDVVLDALGDLLVDNVNKIMEQKDTSKRTKKMIEHYNRIKKDTKLHPVTRSKLMNIIRQQYNKNLTQEQKDDFTSQYEAILAADPGLTGPRKPTGVPKKTKAPPRSGVQSNLTDKSGKKVYMVNKRFGKGGGFRTPRRPMLYEEPEEEELNIYNIDEPQPIPQPITKMVFGLDEWPDIQAAGGAINVAITAAGKQPIDLIINDDRLWLKFREPPVGTILDVHEAWHTGRHYVYETYRYPHQIQ